MRLEPRAPLLSSRELERVAGDLHVCHPRHVIVDRLLDAAHRLG
jgi:hypothetical protein